MSSISPRKAKGQKIRQILAYRRDLARGRGRALATHVILAAGVTEPKAASTIAAGLRTAAKRIGLEPVATTRTRRSVNGRESVARTVAHWTREQVRRMVSGPGAYQPRKPSYAATVRLLAI